MVDSGDKIERAAQRFLARGALGDVDQASLAEACNGLIRFETQRSSMQAVKIAERFVKHARPVGGVLLLTSLRAKGWACLVHGKYRDAERSYLKARSMVDRDPHMRARIDRILIDVYMYLGDYTESRRRARLALATFRRINADRDLAMTQVNYANLLHRQDRHRQARKYYQSAGDFFAGCGDDLSAARCYYNLANSLVQLFEFEKAAQLYQTAKETFAGNGYDLYANDCRNGIAWLHMLEGDYHVALKDLAECEEGYLKATQRRGVVLCKLDRAEAYLGLNLYGDALEAAREAESQAKQLSIGYERSKAAFFQARAHWCLGAVSAARRALLRAEKGLSVHRSPGFQAAVRLLSMQLKSHENGNEIIVKHMLGQFRQRQLPLWEAICDLELAILSPDDSGVLRRLSTNPAVKTVPVLTARHRTLMGDRQAVRGRIKQARRHWSRAADILDRVRAKLPPVDLRNSFAQQEISPHRRLIETHLESDPASAAAWSERHHTAGPWATLKDLMPVDPVRQNAEESLARLAHQVTMLTGSIDGRENQRSLGSIEGNVSLSRLQRTVRLNLAALDDTNQIEPERPSEVIDVINQISRRQPVVQFHFVNNDLIAFVHEQGTTRFHRYEDGAKTINEFIGRWRFMLGRQLYDCGDCSSADLNDERRLLSSIGRWLWSPLEISTRRRRILVIPNGKLSNLPFAAIIPGQHPLVDDHELILSPSLRHHHHARNLRVRSQRIEAFVGRTDGLKYARRELAALKAGANGNLKTHDPCRREDVPNDRAALLWHYTGHATLRVDNPFYSSLEMSDGPLFAADFRLKTNRIGLVMLAGCRTGQQVCLPGEESTGLVRSMLEMGARNVIASHWAVTDHSASLWMTDFYNNYFDNKPTAASARQGSIKVRDRYPSAFHWAAFSVFGAG